MSVHISRLAALAIVLAASGQAAHAAAIPFTEALNFSYNPDASGIGTSACCDYLNTINTAPAAPASSVYQQSGTWGSVYGSASADLSSGQLKVRTAAVNADGSAYPAMQTNAIFGDSFTTSTASGAPFAWTVDARAAFTIRLDGLLDSSAPLPELGPSAFVLLSILRPGTLDPSLPLVNGPNAEEYFYWNIGNPNAQIYYTDQSGNSQILTPTGSYDSIPSTLTASFNPGGDFDWVLLLGASGQLGGANSSFDIDLSHTLTLSYAGPDGSVTSDPSGSFRNFDATLPVSVPEPAMLPVFASVAAMLGMLRRRRG